MHAFASLPRSFIRGDHFADVTVSENCRTVEGRPLDLPTEAADPKAEYLEWHRGKVFGKSRAATCRPWQVMMTPMPFAEGGAMPLLEP